MRPDHNCKCCSSEEIMEHFLCECEYYCELLGSQLGDIIMQYRKQCCRSAFIFCRSGSRSRQKSQCGLGSGSLNLVYCSEQNISASNFPFEEDFDHCQEKYVPTHWSISSTSKSLAESMPSGLLEDISRVWETLSKPLKF